MVSTKGRGGSEKSKAEEGGDNGGGGEYEESRAQRIKENMERMKKLGIADLSNQLKRRPPPSSSSLRKTKPQHLPSDDPPRRSSRLKELPRPSYSENKKPPKIARPSQKVEIHIPVSENPEIYTEEQEKLLGDSVAAWTLLVDGFDEDGQRIYDPHLGKSCHQCRQKTLGLRTTCSKCKTVSGQFCGDCLYMRYGENVIEVNLKQDWVCPVCRGICNCSRCRRDKGWNPTGAIYRKAQKLGFKSVAHYLIHTRREGAESPSTGGSRSVDDDEKEGPSDAVVQSGAKEHDMVRDSDSDYEGGEHDEEQDEEQGNSDEEQGNSDSNDSIE